MRSHLASGGVVIIGAGHAGSDLASLLRQQGYRDRIMLIGDEAYPPYRRPPLSKTFLSGQVSLESLYIKPVHFYADQQIECRFGAAVAAIDPKARSVVLFDGTVVRYDHAVLATGGRPRRLALPGATRDNVHHVRTISDVLRLKVQFKAGKYLVVIGGGYIGLEVAAAAIQAGLKVAVVESQPRVLARVTAAELSSFYERLHRGRGVDLYTGVAVRELHGDPFVHTVELDDGRRLAADVVIVGIGLVPNTDLAAAADIELADGIAVDEYCRSSEPSVYAIGDCANQYNTSSNRRLRLESVPNAMEHARVCAAAICGKARTTAAVPWFWSDQYDVKLQIAGLSHGYDQLVVRGDLNGNSFSIFYLREGALIAADVVNRPQEFVLAKNLIASGARPVVAELGCDAAPLSQVTR